MHPMKIYSACTYRASYNNRCVGTMGRKVISNFHPGVARSNDQYILARVALAWLVAWGVDNITWKVFQSREHWNILCTILTTCHNKKLRRELDCGALWHVLCHNGPTFFIIVICGWLHAGEILWLNVETLNIVIQVLHKQGFWYVCWCIYRVWHVWQLTELLCEMQLEAIIRAVAPEWRATALALDDGIRNWELAKACCRCEACWPSTNNQHCNTLHFKEKTWQSCGISSVVVQCLCVCSMNFGWHARVWGHIYTGILHGPICFMDWGMKKVNIYWGLILVCRSISI